MVIKYLKTLFDKLIKDDKLDTNTKDLFKNGLFYKYKNEDEIFKIKLSSDKFKITRGSSTICTISESSIYPSSRSPSPSPTRSPSPTPYTFPALNNTFATPYVCPKYTINTCAYILDIVLLQPNLIHYINTTPSGLFYKFENQDKPLGLIKKSGNNAVIWYPRRASDDTFPYPHGCDTGTQPACITAVCKRPIPSLELGKTVENPVIIPPANACGEINYIIVRPHLVHIIKTNNAGLYFRNGSGLGHSNTIHRFKKVNNNIVLHEKQSDGRRNTPSTDANCIRPIPNCTLTSTQDGSFQKPIVLNVGWDISQVFTKVFSNHLDKFTSTNNCIWCKYTATDGMLLTIQKIANNKYSCSEMNGANKRTWIQSPPSS